MSEEKIEKKFASIYRSQVEVIRSFPKEQQLKMLWMLIDYDLDGIEPDFEDSKEEMSAMEVFWKMSQPLSDARTQKAINGKKGGIASGKKRAEGSKPKQSEAKRSKTKQAEANRSKGQAEKEKEKDTDKEKDTFPSRTSPSLLGEARPEGWTEDDERDWIETNKANVEEVTREEFKEMLIQFGQWHGEGDDGS